MDIWVPFIHLLSKMKWQFETIKIENHQVCDGGKFPSIMGQWSLIFVTAKSNGWVKINIKYRRGQDTILKVSQKWFNLPWPRPKHFQLLPLSTKKKYSKRPCFCPFYILESLHGHSKANPFKIDKSIFNSALIKKIFHLNSTSI